jgi:hypothetical protein
MVDPERFGLTFIVGQASRIPASQLCFTYGVNVQLSDMTMRYSKKELISKYLFLLKHTIELKVFRLRYFVA